MNDGGTLGKTEINVLQAVNLTLGTGGFLALADGLPQLIGEPRFVSGGTPDWALFAKVLYATLLVFWIVKLLAENHRSFANQFVKAHPGYAVFQLVMTVSTFMFLIASARQVQDLSVSAFWLMLSMTVSVFWLIRHRCRFTPIGKEVFDAGLYPWWWWPSTLLSAAGALWIYTAGVGFDSCCLLFLLILMLGALALDARRSDTFSLEPQPAGQTCSLVEI